MAHHSCCILALHYLLVYMLHSRKLHVSVNKPQKRKCSKFLSSWVKFDSKCLFTKFCSELTSRDITLTVRKWELARSRPVVTKLSVHYSHIKTFCWSPEEPLKKSQVRGDATTFPVWEEGAMSRFPFRGGERFHMSSCASPLLSVADGEPEKQRERGEKGGRQTEGEKYPFV